MYTFTPKGVCSKSIEITVKDNTIAQVSFQSGCPGSLFAITRLVEGLTLEQTIEKCKGILCGKKNTSCPDQLAQALELIKNKKKSPQLTYSANTAINNPFGIQAAPKAAINPFA